MMSLNQTTALLGIGLAAVIIVLMRRDHLHASHGVFWIVAAAAAALFGAWPGLIDHVATVIGINYPPTLLLLGAVSALLLKCLQSDIELTRIERQLRRLNQRLALYEANQDDR